jgi:hypothetical protein
VQVPLQGLAVGDVHEGPDPAGDGPGFVPKGRGVAEKKADPAILETHLELHVAHLDAVGGRPLHGQFMRRQFDPAGKQPEMGRRRADSGVRDRFWPGGRPKKS